MEMDELKCPLCKENYDETVFIPRMLINCGHTFCQVCIQNFLDNSMNNSFTCPEDENLYQNITKVEGLPKNIQVLKLRKSNLPPHNTNSNSKDKPLKNVLLKIPSGKNIFTPQSSNNNLKTSPFISTLDVHEPGYNPNTHNTYNSNDTLEHHPSVQNFRSSIRKVNSVKEGCIKFCKIHPTRTLEIICLDHKIKLCSNCALFGEHKNHNIINEEDFIKEVEVKAEILIELFDLIDTNINNLMENENKTITTELDFILHQSEDKLQIVKKNTENFFNELYINIKNYQTLVNNKIEEKFERISNKIKSIKEIPSELITKSECWKNIVQKKLDKLDSISETNDILNLIDTDNISQDQDLIVEAENIVNEFVKLKDFPLNDIGKMIDDITVVFNYEEANNISNKLVTINESNQNDTDILKLDENDKRRVNNSISISNTNNTSDNKFLNTTGDITNNIGFQTLLNIDNNDYNNYALTENQINNSILNLSEDSALINLNKCGQLNVVLTNSSSNPNLLLNNTVTGSGSGGKHHLQTQKIKSQYNSVHNIPLPINKGGKDKSKSPPRISNDKIVFIKTQMKNEIANFTGYDIGDEGSKIIAEILPKSKVKEMKLTKTNLSDAQCFNILKAVEASSLVNNINIAKNFITDKSCESIISCLKNSKGLKTIYLTNNNLSSSAKEKIKSYATGKNMLKIFL